MVMGTTMIGNGRTSRLGSTPGTGHGASVPLDRVLLSPWGDVHSRTGDFTIDNQAAELILQAYADHAVDLPVDYEHQTLALQYASPDGLAPASGWIKELEALPGTGLFGLVAWTANGQRKIDTGEYRYISPVVLVRKADGRAVALHSVALTNRPAIPNMPRLR